MQITVDILPTSEASIAVDLPWDELFKASDKAYRDLVKKVEIQGFRRGKAPRAVLERRVGANTLYQETLREMFPDIYQKAVDQYSLRVVADPNIEEMPTITVGEPCQFTFTVPVISPAQLPNYRSMHFEREEAIVTSEEIDKELADLQEQKAYWQIVDRPVQYGDRVKADLKLVSGEKTISDLKDNLFEVVEDRTALFTGMDEHLIGMTVGEHKSFTTTIPADYANTKLAGQEAHYDVLIHSIEEKIVPALDDAFAAEASDGQYQTIEEFSKGLSDSILEKRKSELKEELQNRVLEAIIEQSQITLHPALIDKEIDIMMSQMDQMLRRDYNATVNQYLASQGKTREEGRETFREPAEQRLKINAVLDEVIKRENLTATPEDIQAFLDKYTPPGQQRIIQAQEQQQHITEHCLHEKAKELLVRLTTEPDLDEEGEEQARAETKALAAALASEAAAAEAQPEITDAEAAEAQPEVTDAEAGAPPAETSENETSAPLAEETSEGDKSLS